MAAGFPGFPKEMTTFFRSLKRNNRREWFQPRKHVFEQHVKEPMIELVTALNSEFAKANLERLIEVLDDVFDNDDSSLR